MEDIMLLAPQVDLDFPLMKAIELRRTKRKWLNESLSLQEISDILWCACGETKKATKKSKNRRTIPSACNSQLVTVYACLESGVYKYIEADHRLEAVVEKDIRSILGTQKMMKTAPFGLIYVCDTSKKTGLFKSSEAQLSFLAGTESGLISQNVSLYCASAHLNTVLLALINRETLSEAIGFSEDIKITYVQIIGKKIDG